jgi:CheY-like chemotaxis protein
MEQRTVLVVEDEPAVRALLSLVLETRDYRVVTADDGPQALERVRVERPDLILLDLMLPGMDGWAVLDAIRRELGGARIPVIAMTASSRWDGTSMGGVDAFLRKPFDMQGLLDALDEVFGPEATGERLAVHS